MTKIHSTDEIKKSKKIKQDIQIRQAALDLLLQISDIADPLGDFDINRALEKLIFTEARKLNLIQDDTSSISDVYAKALEVFHKTSEVTKDFYTAASDFSKNLSGFVQQVDESKDKEVEIARSTSL